MPHTMPANLLGGDMLWWREGAGVHTLVTLAWELAGLTGPEALELHFVLHDETGEEVHRWTRSYSPGDVIIVDSARLRDAPSTASGVLGIFATAEGEWIELHRHIEDILDFVDGKPATVEGHLESPWLFARPWVITREARLSGYHGGDRHCWSGLAQPQYDMLGRGEVNPMAVVRRAGLRTHVHAFNSHDDGVEGDQFIDARLYNGEGTLVTSRDRWLAAPDAGAAHGDLDDLIPGEGDFTGHVSFTFTPRPAGEYPGRLQALMEYRTDVSTARVMAWSDQWGSPHRLLQRIPRRAGYRAWARPPFTTYISITNAGPRPRVDGAGEYAHVAKYTVTLRAPDGALSSTTGILGAPRHALRFGLRAVPGRGGGARRAGRRLAGGRELRGPRARAVHASRPLGCVERRALHSSRVHVRGPHHIRGRLLAGR